MPRLIPLSLLVFALPSLAATTAASATSAATATTAATARANPRSATFTIPRGWPTHLALGLADPSGDAQHLHSRAPLDARYQYLSGGVNTGGGWATWDPHASFASDYVGASIAAHMIPVLTYYQLLQSKPSIGADERHRDLSNLRNPSAMAGYWADWSTLLRSVATASAKHVVVVHVEPDLWGYLEQAHATALARRFAHHLIALRDRLAPQLLLAWHLSVWGTNIDPTYSKPSLRQMDRLAAESAGFYASLHARFDLVFNDVTDRDAGFYKVIEGNPHTGWGPADFRRENAYIAGFTRRTRVPVVLWQLPLGNTFQNNTWDHFRDNRVQWWLGKDSRAHLGATEDAGVIGLLFGGGGDGTTSAQTDGGLFYRLARRYEARPLPLLEPLMALEPSGALRRSSPAPQIISGPGAPARSRLSPSRYTSPIPISAPGIASSAVVM